MVKVAQLVDQRRNVDVVVIIKVTKPPEKCKKELEINLSSKLEDKNIYERISITNIV